MNGVFLGLAGGDAQGNPLVNVQTGDGPKQYAVDKKAVVTVDGGTVGLADLRVGDLLVLSGQPAVTVVATRTYTAPLTEVPEEKVANKLVATPSLPVDPPAVHSQPVVHPKSVHPQQKRTTR